MNAVLGSFGIFCLLPSKSEHILIQQNISGLEVVGYMHVRGPLWQKSHQSQLLFCSITICDSQSNSAISFMNTILYFKKKILLGQVCENYFGIIFNISFL